MILSIFLAAVYLALGWLVWARWRGPVLRKQHDNTAPRRRVEFTLAESGARAFVLSVSDQQDGFRRESVMLPDTATKALLPCLERFAGMLVGGVAVASSLPRVVLEFDASTARALATGTMELMPSGGDSTAVRGIARRVLNKRIAAHGEIHLGLNSAAVGLALWHAASVVTAQKFLVEINARLTTLERHVANVYAFLADQQRTQVESHLSWLISRSEAWASGDLSPSETFAVASQLELAEVGLRAAGGHLLRRQALQVRGLEEIDWDGGWRSARESTDKIETQLKELGATSDGIVLTLTARIVAAVLRAQIHSNARLATGDLDDVARQLRENSLQWAKASKVVETKSPEVKARLQAADRDREMQSQISTTLSSEVNRLARLSGELSHTLVHARLQLSEDVEGTLRLELEVDGSGHIQRAFRLLPLAQPAGGI